ncbi:immediate early response gene 5 protein-like [Heptranchias perlo]|uniref:immediate early response gene 5 protein-like n=1 Tax=Heptranchias perlo TaxID=212740 RepID=UPI00355A9EEF
MDLKVEAQRVMAVALGKMYSSRLQRGGIRLHKSLLLSLVLRSARDVYLNVRAEQEASEEAEAAAAMEIEPRAEDRESGTDQGLTPSGVEAEEVPVESECSQSASNGIPRRSTERECIDSAECIDAECIESATPGRYNVSESPQGRPGEAERSDPSVCPDCDTSGRPLETAAPGLGQDVAEETPVTRREAGDVRPTPDDGVCGPDRSRKRRKGSDHRDWAEPECLPNKRARLEEEEEALVSGRPGQEVETSNIHSLVSVFGSGFTGLLSKGKAESPKDQSVSPGQICRDRVLSKLGIWVRAIVAY